MAKIDLTNPIEDLLEAGGKVKPLRPYIGYSGVGGSCRRALWYEFHWAFENFIPTRVQRIFDRGHWEEKMIIRALRANGLTVEHEQREAISHHGHAAGHIDGTVINVPGAEKKRHLLEIKTANDKNYKLIKKQGIKKAKPVYYGQATLYMGRFSLYRTLHIVANKDTEERYYERLRFNQDDYDLFNAVIMDILMTEVAPRKIGDATWFECKFCRAFPVCQAEVEPMQNCRTCNYGTIEDEGEWSCGLTTQTLTLQEQRDGCEKWTKLESLS